MPSAVHEFPVEQFLELIRAGKYPPTRFVNEANNLNTEWIYQTIKHCHNSILEMKEQPATKLNALYVVRDLIETCQVPCLNLVETFMLPIVYEIAIEKPQEKGPRRGANFFQHNGKTPKIPDIEEIGIKFMELCTEILCAGSNIKPKRTFQNYQLRQKSQFYDHFEKFKKYGIDTTPSSAAELRNFNSQFIHQGRQKYLQNLKKFHGGRHNYSEYFVTKIIQSVESDNNPLLNQGNQSVSSLSNELDMRKLLRQGDTLITTPLIEQLLLKMKTLESFMGRKNCLSLLADFIKWGDAQALVKLCYDGELENIARRVAQVNGKKGLIEGENIYPQVKGQRDGKRKFYTQYLKTIQVISNCFQNQKLPIQEASRIQDLYIYFKKQMKFQFPQNLMSKRIETDFRQNLLNNQQRNALLMKKLKQQGSSIRKTEKSSKREGGISTTLLQLNKNLEECLDQILKVSSNEQEVNARMTKIIDLKNKYESEVEKIDQFNSELKEEEVVEMLDNGIEIAQIVQKLQVIHKDYKNKTIDFNEFQQKHALITRQLQAQQSQVQSYNKSSKTPSPGSQVHLRHSLEEVVNSFNVNEKQRPHPTTLPSFRKEPQEQFNRIIVSQPNGGFMKAPAAPNNEPSQKQPENMLMPGLASAPHKVIESNEHELLIQVTSSIISNKEQKQNYKEIQIREKRGSGPSLASQSSSLRERVEGRRKQRESKIKELSQVEVQISQRSSSYVHSIMQKHDNFSSSPSEERKPLQSHVEQVQYVQYVAPDSVRYSQPNGPANNTAPNFAKTNLMIIEEGLNQYGLANGKTLSNDRNSKNGFPVQQANKSQKSYQSSQNGSKFLVTQQVQQPKRSFTKTMVGPSGFNGSPSGRRPEYHTAAYKKSENNIFNMYMAEKKGYSPYRTITNEPQAHNNSSDSNKENPKPENFSKALEAEIPKQGSHMGMNDSKSSSSFKTCKGGNEINGQKQSNFVLNSNNYAGGNQKFGDSLRNSDNEELYTARNQSFSDQQSIRRHPQKAYQTHFIEQDDYIKEPEYRPLEDSYYNPKEAEMQIKQSLKPEFRNVFKMDRELIPSTFRSHEMGSLVEQSQFTQFPVSSVGKTSAARPHEEYMIAKLRRQYEKQKDVEAKDLNGKVIGIQLENSRLRNQMLTKQSRIKLSRKNSSNSSQPVVQFSRSRSNYSNSPLTHRPDKSISAVSQFPLQGSRLNQSIYDRFLGELNDEKTKKACLRKKSVIYKNDHWEIGCMFKHPKESTILTIYLTPYSRINNFNFSLSKEPNLQIESLSKTFSQIPENKQMKLEFLCKLKNIPYGPPMMNISYGKGNEQKNLSFYLPLSFNKFIDFQPVQPSQIRDEIRLKERQVKCIQFDINLKVAKTSAVLEYFPQMVEMNQEIGQKINRFATIGSFKGQSFSILMSTKGKDKAMLQAISKNGKQSQTMEYFLLTIRKLMGN